MQILASAKTIIKSIWKQFWKKHPVCVGDYVDKKRWYVVQKMPIFVHVQG